jgi:hypothetical protein
MAWPTTDIGTTHMDAGTDNPALARADIKQMADNVNAMQDMVSMTGAQQNDVLRYSVSNDKFEPVSINTIVTNSNAPMAIVVPNDTVTSIGTGYSPNASGYYWNIHFAEAHDPNSFFSQDSNGLMTFDSGTYVVNFSGQKSSSILSIFRPYSDSLGDYVETASSSDDPVNNGYDTCSIDTNGVFTGFYHFTTSTYNKWAFQYGTGSSATPGTSDKLYRNPIFIYKIA